MNATTTPRGIMNDMDIDLIAVQLVEEMRMDLNDIPYADEYKERDPWSKKYVRI